MKNPRRARLQRNPGQTLSPGGWLPEGQTLCAILRKLVSPQSWSELTGRTGEKWPELRGHSSLGPVRLGLGELDWEAVAEHPLKELITAAHECEPLIDQWNSGALYAKGRRGDPLSSLVEIPPPSAHWDLFVADFSHSIIEDPMGKGRKIYDLRFFVTEPVALLSPESSSTIVWVTNEAKRMKASGEINESTRRSKFARLLRVSMEKAYKAGTSTARPVTWRHINNKLDSWGLWRF